MAQGTATGGGFALQCFVDVAVVALVWQIVAVASVGHVIHNVGEFLDSVRIAHC
jgi:hypothetical protein